MDNTEWFKEVERAAEHAEKVYNDEVKRVSEKAEKLEKKDLRTLKVVEKEVELDAWFALHHIEYLGRVVKHEEKELARLVEKLEKATEKGNDKRAERLTNRIAEKTVDADKHISKVAERVLEHLERDAKAAAAHVAHGLQKLGENSDDYEKYLNDSAQKVEDAISEVLEKFNN